MLMINATRHLETGFGVFAPLPMTAWVRRSRHGHGKAPEARQKFKVGVENEHLDQILGRPAALC
jgi:hypothetical protein